MHRLRCAALRGLSSRTSKFYYHFRLCRELINSLKCYRGNIVAFYKKYKVIKWWIIVYNVLMLNVMSQGKLPTAVIIFQ